MRRMLRKILTFPLSKMPIYLFPFFVLAIEWIFRHVANVDSQEFMGPSLSVAGLTLLIPLIVPKKRELPRNLARAIRAHGYDPDTVTTNAERRFIWVVLLAIGLLIVLWLVSLYLAIKTPLLHWRWFSFALWAGLVSYVIGIVFSQIKEGV